MLFRHELNENVIEWLYAHNYNDSKTQYSNIVHP